LREFSDGSTRVLVQRHRRSWTGCRFGFACHQLRRARGAGRLRASRGPHRQAGNQGKAITIVAPVDELSMRAIERLTGQTVKRVVPKVLAALQILDALPGKPIAGLARPRVIQSGRFVRVARDSDLCLKPARKAGFPREHLGWGATKGNCR